MSVLDELRALEAQATPAPWDATPGYVDPLCHEQQPLIRGGWDGEWDFRDDADCALIAAARNVLPTLLDIAEAAQQVEAGGWLLDIPTGRAHVDKQAFSSLLDALARLRAAERAA